MTDHLPFVLSLSKHSHPRVLGLRIDALRQAQGERVWGCR